MELSFLSRTTSISNSFQPKSDSSNKTSLVGDNFSPLSTIVINSFSSYATPPPDPPSVKEALIMIGYPIRLTISKDSSKL